MLNFLIFSKNRACQLDLLLRSIKTYCKSPHSVNILYTLSEEHKESYDICFSQHQKLNWIREFDFRSQTLDLFKMNNLCLLTDDTVFFRNFKFYDCLQENETFSYRLGYNTIIQDHVNQTKQQHLHPLTLNKDIISWNPNNYPSNMNYGYPFSFDGHVYKNGLLEKILRGTGNFNNTNEIEGILHSQRHIIKTIYSNLHSSCVNVPCNNLSGLTASGNFMEYSMNYLNNVYCSGKRINLQLDPVIGCHQEFNFEFVNEYI